MQKKIVIEFAGMAGSGKTYHAQMMEPFLRFKVNRYIVHKRLTNNGRIKFHCVRMLSSLRLFFLRPFMFCHTLATICMCHPHDLRRMIAVTINYFYKLDIVLNRRGSTIIDEGIVHAIWSVSLYSKVFPYKLCEQLSKIAQKYNMRLCVIYISTETTSILKQFYVRSSETGFRHYLAKNREIDEKEFLCAVNKYEEVIRIIKPNIEQYIEIDNDSKISLNTVLEKTKTIIQRCGLMNEMEQI